MTLHLSIDVSALLRCSSFRASLNRQGHGYVCLGCKRTFPQELGVTRFVTAENSGDSFGFQWQRYARLDHQFVEWVTALPVEWKLRAGARKHILKKLAERLGIPSPLLHRKKRGFQRLLVEWMRNDVKGQFLRVLLEPRTLQRGYFKPLAVRSLVDEHVRGRRNRSGLLWRMLVPELWHRNFME